MKKILITTYAVEFCKHLCELVMRHCCGCRNALRGDDCLTLTEDEKIELYFDQALQKVDRQKLVNRVLRCVMPFELTIETEGEFVSWTRRIPPLTSEMYQKIKNTVKVIRMY